MGPLLRLCPVSLTKAYLKNAHRSKVYTQFVVKIWRLNFKKASLGIAKQC